MIENPKPLKPWQLIIQRERAEMNKYREEWKALPDAQKKQFHHSFSEFVEHRRSCGEVPEISAQVATTPEAPKPQEVSHTEAPKITEPTNPSPDPLAGLSDAEVWHYEWLIRDDVQREFPNEKAYVAFKRAQKAGRVRIAEDKSIDTGAQSSVRSSATVITSEGLENQWRAEFKKIPELQAEFAGNEEAYVHYRKAIKEGRARVVAK